MSFIKKRVYEGLLSEKITSKFIKIRIWSFAFKLHQKKKNFLLLLTCPWASEVEYQPLMHQFVVVIKMKTRHKC